MGLQYNNNFQEPFTVCPQVIIRLLYAYKNKFPLKLFKVIGIDAGMASTRGKSNDVKHTRKFK